MTPNEYKELVEFIGIKFDRVDTRLGAMDDRLTRVEVGNESLRDDLRAVAEGVLANSRKIEENGRRIEDNGAKIEENSLKIDALTTRVGTLTSKVGTLTSKVGTLTSKVGTLTSKVGALEASVSTRFDDHEQRIASLEWDPHPCRTDRVRLWSDSGNAPTR